MDDSCVEKLRLAEEYDLATKNFSEGVEELHGRMGTTGREEYARLERAANEARVKSDQTRLALEHHIAAHRC